MTNEQRRTLSVLVHAGSKIGKTTFASTAPPPILALDAEGSWNFIKRPWVAWDPMKGPPPEADGRWEVCRVVVRDWRAVQTTYQWLTQAPHPFKSVAVDSITEMQRRCKANLRGTDQMRTQDWGDLLTAMDSTIRNFRDLILMDVGVDVVVFVAETAEKNGKWSPHMQGQIGNSLPYYVDVCGYLYTERLKDENGQPLGDLIRRLLITPHDLFVAGERVQGTLPDVVNNPNLSDMIKTVYDNITLSEVVE